MRKSVNCQVTIDFSFTSDWLSGWFEFSGTIIGCCEISSECLLCVISTLSLLILHFRNIAMGVFEGAAGIGSFCTPYIVYSVSRCIYTWVVKAFLSVPNEPIKKNNPTITESAVPRMSRGNEIWKADCLIMSPSSKQSVLTYRKLKYWH